MSFSERLLEVMKENGYTKYRVAKALNMSATTISNYLNNKTKPDNTKLEVLSRLLRVNRRWLLTGEGDKYRKDAVGKEIHMTVDSVNEEDVFLTHHLMSIIDKQASALRIKDEQISSLIATNESLSKTLTSISEKLAQRL